MTRLYTPAQVAARLEYTRQWRKRNQAKIKAHEARYAKRRTLLARKRRHADPERFRREALLNSRRHREHRAAYSRAYRQRQIADNPNWGRERWAEFAKRHPGYLGQWRRRKRLHDAWSAWARTCAQGRGLVLTVLRSGASK